MYYLDYLNPVFFQNYTDQPWYFSGISGILQEVFLNNSKTMQHIFLHNCFYCIVSLNNNKAVKSINTFEEIKML